MNSWGFIWPRRFIGKKPVTPLVWMESLVDDEPEHQNLDIKNGNLSAQRKLFISESHRWDGNHQSSHPHGNGVCKIHLSFTWLLLGFPSWHVRDILKGPEKIRKKIELLLSHGWKAAPFLRSFLTTCLSLCLSATPLATWSYYLRKDSKKGSRTMWDQTHPHHG